jgi:hypothetical protein
LVCLSHEARHAICLKATSKLDAYKNRPDRMAGIIFVRAGTLSCFNQDTIIQPDNQVPIPHPTLATQHASGDFEILGAMHDGFPMDLAKAVRNSKTMSPREQKRILGILDRLGKLGT